MSHIHISGLRKRYAGGTGLEHLSLEIEEGEFFVLLGPSGCGKTTALRCLAGLEIPDSGKIRLGDRLVADPEQGKIVPPEQRGLGMVFQSYALWPHMTVTQNIAYPLKAQTSTHEQRQQAIRRVLDLVDLAAVAHRYPSELSGGQQQRVALARALASRPKLVLFDEPLSNLDAQLRVRLRQELRRVHQEINYTAVYVTHDQDEALALADRIAIMRAGRIEQLGTPQTIFESPATRFVAEFVGFDNFLPAQVIAKNEQVVQVQLAGWFAPLNARATGDIQVDDKVLLVVRSSSLQVATGPVIAGSNSVSVTFDEAYFQGEYYSCTLRLADHTPLNVRIPSKQWREQQAALIHDEIHLIFPEDAVIALTE